MHPKARTARRPCDPEAAVHRGVAHRLLRAGVRRTWVRLAAPSVRGPCGHSTAVPEPQRASFSRIAASRRSPTPTRGLQQVEDVGPKVAAGLRTHLNRDGARAELARLRKLGFDLDVRDEDLPPRIAADASLAGKTLVITGAIADPRSGEKIARPSSSACASARGASSASSASASIDMLVCGANVGASKTAKADKLGVETVDQDEIWRPLIAAHIA